MTAESEPPSGMNARKAEAQSLGESGELGGKGVAVSCLRTIYRMLKCPKFWQLEFDPMRLVKLPVQARRLSWSFPKALGSPNCVDQASRCICKAEGGELSHEDM